MDGPSLSLFTPLSLNVDKPAASGNAPSKISSTAKDFESLLLSQMLRGMRESGSGWFGTGEDQSMDAAMGLAEEQLGHALVAGGGLGLSKLVESGLKGKS